MSSTIIQQHLDKINIPIHKIGQNLGLLRKNINKFTLENMSKKLDEIVSPNIEKIPTITTLKLPKLKRVDSKLDLPKIKLPTLKKV